MTPLMTSDWVVYTKDCLYHTGTVVEYPARYTHCIAITNARLLAVDDREVAPGAGKLHAGQGAPSSGCSCCARRLHRDNLDRPFGIALMNGKQRQVIAEKVSSTVRALELLEFDYLVNGPKNS